jgi:hypothetical protein
VWLFYNSKSTCRVTFPDICPPLDELFQSNEGEKKLQKRTSHRVMNRDVNGEICWLWHSLFLCQKIRRRNNGAAQRFDLKRFFLNPLVKRFPVLLKEMWNQSTKRNKMGKIGRHVWNALAGRKRAGGIQSNVSFSWRWPLVKLITYCVGPSHHIVELWNQVNIYNWITRNISN